MKKFIGTALKWWTMLWVDLFYCSMAPWMIITDLLRIVVDGDRSFESTKEGWGIIKRFNHYFLKTDFDDFDMDEFYEYFVYGTTFEEEEEEA